MKKLNVLLAAAALGLGAAGGADAAVTATGLTRSETVRFADLNTDNVEGAAVLYGRIKQAAHRVCEYSTTEPEFTVSRLDVRCVHDAVSDAVAKVARPMVTAYAVEHGTKADERTPAAR